MNVMLQRHCAKFIYVIPDGLRELMSDISREVLRIQPVHTYTFIADYLDALLITRENARVAARLVESITQIGATTVELLTRTGMTRQEADEVAAIIQNYFRQFLAHKKAKMVEIREEDVDEEDAFVKQILSESDVYFEDINEAASVIQNAYRAFKEKQEHQKDILFGMVDWRIAARSAIYLYRKTGVTHDEANRAATLIKAAYKGYYTRRIMRKLISDGFKHTEEIELITEDEQQEGEMETEDNSLAVDTTIVEDADATVLEEGELPLAAETSETGDISTNIYSSTLVEPTDGDSPLGMENVVPSEIPEVEPIQEEAVETESNVVDDNNEKPVAGDEAIPVESPEVVQDVPDEITVAVDGESPAVGDVTPGEPVPPEEIPPEKTDGDGDVTTELEDKQLTEPMTEIIVPAPSEATGSTAQIDTDRTDYTETTEITATETETFETTTETEAVTTDEETTEN